MKQTPHTLRRKSIFQIIAFLIFIILFVASLPAHSQVRNPTPGHPKMTAQQQLHFDTLYLNSTIKFGKILLVYNKTLNPGGSLSFPEDSTYVRRVTTIPEFNDSARIGNTATVYYRNGKSEAFKNFNKAFIFDRDESFIVNPPVKRITYKGKYPISVMYFIVLPKNSEQYKKIASKKLDKGDQ